MAILEVRSVDSGYADLQIIWDVSLSLQASKLTSLVGGNGVGKTTLLRTIIGLLRPWKGNVFFEEQDISTLSPHAKATIGLVLVPEGRQLFTDMSVVENLDMGASPRRTRSQYQENLDRVFQLFPRLYERRDQKAGTLSGGEQQMLAVGRGIMAQPKVLMIDELSLGLAPVLSQQLFMNLIQLRNMGISLLLVEQNVQMALAISDYTYVLSKGRIEMQGPSCELINNQQIRQTYLGMAYET
jgi:branched-chain amino acid transport system ATP-binding protein